jgi:hypothetical protein
MKSLIPVLSLLSLSACATTGMFSGTGGAFLAMEVVEPHAVTAHKLGAKTGTACTANILGFYSSGDGSIQAAAKAGGITNISTVDKKFTNYAYIYGKMCTIVTGN